MLTRWLCVLLAALLLPTCAAAQTKVSAAVEQEIARRSQSRVIIITRADPFLAAGGPSMTAPQSYLKGMLGRPPASPVNRIGQLPAVTATINGAELERLRNDPNVDRVVADIPVPPTLFVSVPYVGADKLLQQGINGTGWSVAVLDTGIDPAHPALAGAVRAQACFSTPTSAEAPYVASLCPNGLNVSVQANAAQGCPASLDGCDHGTHVAGIIAGHNMSVAGHNDFSGVAPAAGIVAIQVFSKFNDPAWCQALPTPCVLSFPSDQFRALDWVLRNRTTHRIAAVNMSLGGGYYPGFCDRDSALTELVERLFAQGVATVVSAGNDGLFDGVGSPGCISSAVTVSAVRRDGVIDVAYSNVGRQTDIAAPGTSIMSSVPGTGYEEKSGTSMAAPHVAAAWTLLTQAYPTATGAQLLQRLLSSAQIQDPRSEVRVALLKLSPPTASPAADLAALKASIINDDTRLSAIATQSFIVDSPAASGRLQSAVAAECKDLQCSLRPLGGGKYRLDVDSNATNAPIGAHGELLEKLRRALAAQPGLKVYDNTPVPAAPR